MRRQLSACDTGGEPRAFYAGCHKWRRAGACGCHCGSVSGRFRTGRCSSSRPLQRFLNSLKVTCSFAVVPRPVQIPQPPTPRRWEQIVDNCVRLGSLLILLLRL